MIQLYAETKEGDKRVIIGITRENLKRLLKGMPIFLRLILPCNEVGIFFGEDKPRLLDQLERVGVELPEGLREAAEENPL